MWDSGGSSGRKCEAAPLFGKVFGTKALVGRHHYVWVRDDRPGLKAALDFLAQGDILVVWKLDRLG